MSAGLRHASKFTVTERANITQPAVYGGYSKLRRSLQCALDVHASVKTVGAGQLLRMSVPLSTYPCCALAASLRSDSAAQLCLSAASFPNMFA